jgi:hypothetical protein
LADPVDCVGSVEERHGVPCPAWLGGRGRDEAPCAALLAEWLAP